MHFLDTITITLAGLVVGNELAVTAFFNPAVRQLESTPQVQTISILAGSLGRLMPVWYVLCLALLALESVLHRYQAAFVPLLAATLIWAGVIIFTISVLVPINNRIASLDTAAPTPGWKQDHKSGTPSIESAYCCCSWHLLPSSMHLSLEFGQRTLLEASS